MPGVAVRWFNLGEALLWLAFATLAFWRARACVDARETRRFWRVAAVLALLSAATDFIEIKTGAWWRPLGLLLANATWLGGGLVLAVAVWRARFRRRAREE